MDYFAGIKVPSNLTLEDVFDGALPADIPDKEAPEPVSGDLDAPFSITGSRRVVVQAAPPVEHEPIPIPKEDPAHPKPKFKPKKFKAQSESRQVQEKRKMREEEKAARSYLKKQATYDAMGIPMPERKRKDPEMTDWEERDALRKRLEHAYDVPTEKQYKVGPYLFESREEYLKVLHASKGADKVELQPLAEEGEETKAPPQDRENLQRTRGGRAVRRVAAAKLRHTHRAHWSHGTTRAKSVWEKTFVTMSNTTNAKVGSMQSGAEDTRKRMAKIHMRRLRKLREKSKFVSHERAPEAEGAGELATVDERKSELTERVKALRTQFAVEKGKNEQAVLGIARRIRRRSVYKLLFRVDLNSPSLTADQISDLYAAYKSVYYLILSKALDLVHVSHPKGLESELNDLIPGYAAEDGITSKHVKGVEYSHWIQFLSTRRPDSILIRRLKSFLCSERDFLPQVNQYVKSHVSKQMANEYQDLKAALDYTYRTVTAFDEENAYKLNPKTRTARTKAIHAEYHERRVAVKADKNISSAARKKALKELQVAENRAIKDLGESRTSENRVLQAMRLLLLIGNVEPNPGPARPQHFSPPARLRSIVFYPPRDPGHFHILTERRDRELEHLQEAWRRHRERVWRDPLNPASFAHQLYPVDIPPEDPLPGQLQQMLLIMAGIEQNPGPPKKLRIERPEREDEREEGVPLDIHPPPVFEVTLPHLQLQPVQKRSPPHPVPKDDAVPVVIMVDNPPNTTPVSVPCVRKEEPEPEASTSAPVDEKTNRLEDLLREQEKSQPKATLKAAQDGKKHPVFPPKTKDTNKVSSRASKNAALVNLKLAEEAQQRAGESDARADAHIAKLEDAVAHAEQQAKTVQKKLDEKILEVDSAGRQIFAMTTVLEDAKRHGFVPLSDDPVATLCFNGKFSTSECKFDEEGLPNVTVTILPDGTWISDGWGLADRVKITAHMLEIAERSPTCSDKTKRMVNIYNGLVTSKELQDDFKQLQYRDKIDFLKFAWYIAFLMTGVVVGSGTVRWQNDVAEWIPERYKVDPPADWRERLAPVQFYSDTLAFQASQVRNTRMAPIKMEGVVPHMPDAADLGTLRAGMCKRLFPVLPVRSRRVLRRLNNIAFDLYDYIAERTANYDADAEWNDHILPRMREGRNAAEIEGIMRGIEMWNADPRQAVSWYLTKPYRCFIKLESYPPETRKPPRFIMSLDLECRGIQMCAMAHALRKIEIGTRECNVKGLTADQITEKLRAKFANVPRVAETDFSSFESCIGPDLKEVVENFIFNLLTPAGSPEADFIDRAMGRREVTVHGPCFNIPHFHHIRMSGDLWTSVGNLLTNIVIIAYCTKRPVAEIIHEGLFEGDDGAFPAPRRPDEVMARATKAGVLLTFDIAPWESLSFCGNHFEVVDGDLTRHRDPYKAAANCSVLFNANRNTTRFDRMLQRSKNIAYLDGPVVPDCFVFNAVVERFTRDTRVDAARMRRMGYTKEYSGYGLESCVPAYLIHDERGRELTDDAFIDIVFERNRRAGGKCEYATIRKMVDILRAAGPGAMDVKIPSPFSDLNNGVYYARDGSRFTHASQYASRLGFRGVEFNDVQNRGLALPPCRDATLSRKDAVLAVNRVWVAKTVSQPAPRPIVPYWWHLVPYFLLLILTLAGSFLIAHQAYAAARYHQHVWHMQHTSGVCGEMLVPHGPDPPVEAPPRVCSGWRGRLHCWREDFECWADRFHYDHLADIEEWFADHAWTFITWSADVLDPYVLLTPTQTVFFWLFVASGAVGLIALTAMHPLWVLDLLLFLIAWAIILAWRLLCMSLRLLWLLLRVLWWLVWLLFWPYHLYRRFHPRGPPPPPPEVNIEFPMAHVGPARYYMDPDFAEQQADEALADEWDAAVNYDF